MVAAFNVVAPKLIVVLVVATVPAKLMPLCDIAVKPPVNVIVSVLASPIVNVPSLENETRLVTLDPLPVKLIFATVDPAVNVLTSTSPVNDAVPPTFDKVNVLTLLILVPVISLLAILSPVDNVNPKPPPVTAPNDISPVVVVAAVLILVAPPKVIAPNVNASSLLLIAPCNVTIPLNPVRSNPPLKVYVSPSPSPILNVPSFVKLTRLVTLDPLPVKLIFATVDPAVNVLTSTSPVKDAVPPTFDKVNVLTLLMLVALMSLLAILSPVDNVNPKPPPVTAPNDISPAVVVAAVLILVAPPKVIAPNVNASSLLLIAPCNVTIPLNPVRSNPPLKVYVSPSPSPILNVPSFVKLTRLVTLDPLPVKLIFATVDPAVNVLTSTSPVKDAVPPTFDKVNVLTLLILVPVMSLLAILSPVDNVNPKPPPVTAPNDISPVVVVARSEEH